MASPAPSDSLLEYFKLETQVCPGCNVETAYNVQIGNNRRTEVVELRWSKQHGLGSGAFGEVWLEKDQDGRLRAVKEVQKNRNPQIDYRKELLAMAQLSRHAKLELFVHFYGWFETTGSVYLAMEYFPLGDLHTFITSSTVCTEDEAKLVACHLLEGLNIMHQMGFTHRDLKPQNIFVKRGSPKWDIRIGDFGISKRIIPTESTALVTQTGTPHFRAPEIDGFLDEDDYEYTNAVDMWSLGCAIFWMLTKEVPFPSYNRRFNFAQGTSTFPVENLEARDVTDQGIEFLKGLICADPQKRPTALTALEAPWITNSTPPTNGMRKLDADAKDNPRGSVSGNKPQSPENKYNTPLLSAAGSKKKPAVPGVGPTSSSPNPLGPVPAAPPDDWLSSVRQFSSNASNQQFIPSEVKSVVQSRPRNEPISERTTRLPHRSSGITPTLRERRGIGSGNSGSLSSASQGVTGSHRRAPIPDPRPAAWGTSTTEEIGLVSPTPTQDTPSPRASNENPNKNNTFKYIAAAATAFAAGSTVNQALQPVYYHPRENFLPEASSLYDAVTPQSQSVQQALGSPINELPPTDAISANDELVRTGQEAEATRLKLRRKRVETDERKWERGEREEREAEAMRSKLRRELDEADDRIWEQDENERANQLEKQIQEARAQLEAKRRKNEAAGKPTEIDEEWINIARMELTARELRDSLSRLDIERFQRKARGSADSITSPPRSNSLRRRRQVKFDDIDFRPGAGRVALVDQPSSLVLVPRADASWRFHEKYKRRYRDFTEGGRSFRQYDHEEAPLTEILPSVEATQDNTPLDISRELPPSQSNDPISLASLQGAESNPRDYKSALRSPKIHNTPSPMRFNYIRATKGDQEALDGRYMRREDPTSFFQVGRVFALLWHKPYGDNGSQLSLQKFHEKGTKYGGTATASVRRMVVGKVGEGSCLCLTISTYGGHGTAKEGVDPSTHAIIYRSDMRPSRLPQETGMTKEPLQVGSLTPGRDQKWHAMSRINFAKTYVVEYGVKVLPIGKITPSSMPHFTSYFREMDYDASDEDEISAQENED